MERGVPAVIVEDIPSDVPTVEWEEASLMRKEGCGPLFVLRTSFFCSIGFGTRIHELRSCHHESVPAGELQFQWWSVRRMPAVKSSTNAVIYVTSTTGLLSISNRTSIFRISGRPLQTAWSGSDTRYASLSAASSFRIPVLGTCATCQYRCIVFPNHEQWRL